MSERNLKTTIVTLFAHHHLLSAAQILDILKGEGKQYNKTSVYRALDQLTADGTLCKLFFTENEALYELQEHHHAHLVCRSCGAVSEAECEYDAPSSIGDFTVDHHHVTLIGLCAKCQS